MNKLLKSAVDVFYRTEAGNVIYRENEEPVLSNEKGIKPLMTQLRSNKAAFKEAAIADKVIGKAAAWMAVLGGAKAVYGKTMSEGAVEILEHAGISYDYRHLVPFIVNRTKDGKCPLEEAVWDVSDADTAYKKLEERIAGLMQAKKEQEQ